MDYGGTARRDQAAAFNFYQEKDEIVKEKAIGIDIAKGKKSE